MPDRKRKAKIILLHIILLPSLLFAFYFFTLAPSPYVGVDESVVEKIAAEHGRQARKPLIDRGRGTFCSFSSLEQVWWEVLSPAIAGASWARKPVTGIRNPDAPHFVPDKCR